VPTVTEYPGLDTAVSGTWTTPTNVQADDGATASVTIAVKNTTVDREQGNYGFDTSIPAGATITSVQIEVEHRVTVTGGIAFLENLGRIGTTDGAVNSDSLEPTVLTARTYASYARPGGGSWTRADLLDGTFKTRIRARSGNNATSVTYHWDYIRVTVVYTEDQNLSGTDSATLSDSSLLETLDEKSGTDSAALGDTSDLTITESKAGSDSAILSDNAQAAVDVSGTDAGSLVDTYDIAIASEVADSITASDSATIEKSITDAGTLADAATLTAQAGTADDATVADTSDLDTGGISKVGVDAATTTDTGVLVVAVDTTDSLTITDSVDLGITSELADTVGVAEIATVDAAIGVVDAGNLVDASTADAALTGVDSAIVTDTGALAVPVETSDSATVTDVSTANVTLIGTDSTTIIDVSAVDAALALSDTLSFADASIVQEGVVDKFASDSVGFEEVSALEAAILGAENWTLTDSGALEATSTVSDALSVTESAEVQEGVVDKVSDDGATLTESSSVSVLIEIIAEDAFDFLDISTIGVGTFDAAEFGEDAIITVTISITDNFTLVDIGERTSGIDFLEGFDTITLGDMGIVSQPQVLLGMPTAKVRHKRDVRGRVRAK
jgi:hypothetical protein